MQQQSLVGISEMISSRMTSGRSLMRSIGDSTGSLDLGGGEGSPLLPVMPGVGSTTGVAAGGSLLFLALGPADSIFLVGVVPSSRV